MVIPFALFTNDCQVKFFIQLLYRNIESINLICHAIAVSYLINSRLNQFGTVFLCILCCSKKNILNILGNESNMNGHFTILYSEGSSSVASLIYMEHTAVCVKLYTINTVFKFAVCGILCTIFGFLCLSLCGFCKCRECSSCCHSGNTYSC